MTTTETRSSMERISARRELLSYPGADGDLAYLGVWVDGLQIAAGVKQDAWYAERNGGAQWALWSAGLSLRPEVGATVFGKSDNAARPLPVADEQDVRGWLNLLADLAERGPVAANRFAPAPTAAAEHITAHITAIAGAAGVPVMGEMLGISLDRGDITAEEALGLDSGDVEDLYEMFVGPAVDTVSDWIANR